jgi:hypothetical protein
MIAGDFGILVFLLNIFTILYPIIAAAVALRRLKEKKVRWILATLLVSSIVFMLMIITIPPAYFLDVVWIWSTQLVLMLILSQRSRDSAEQSIIRLKYLKIFWCIYIVILMLICIGTYKTTFGEDGYKARRSANWWPLKYDINCYPTEQGPNNLKFRWCNRNAFLQIPIGKKYTGVQTIMISALNPDIEAKPLAVLYGGKAGPDKQVILTNKSWKAIALPIDKEHVFETQVSRNGKIERYLVLSLDVSRTWVPKEWRYNNDSRELGICIMIPN